MAATPQRPRDARSVKALAYLNGRLLFEVDVPDAILDRRAPPEFPDSLSVVFLDHDTYGQPVILANATAPIAVRG
jgi:hypothetical protein